MVRPAASYHRRFFQRTQPRRCLPRIQNFCARFSNRLDELPGKSRSAGKWLEKVERNAVRRQPRARGAADLKGGLAPPQRGPIRIENFGGHLRVYPAEDFRGRFGSSAHATLARNDPSEREQIRRHEKLGGDVSVAEIFGKRD